MGERSWRFSHGKLIHAEKLPQEFQLTASTSSADSAAIVRHQSDDVICCLLDLFFYSAMGHCSLQDSLHWGLHLAALKGLLQLICATRAKSGLDNVLSICYLLFFSGLLLYLLIQNTDAALELIFQLVQHKATSCLSQIFVANLKKPRPGRWMSP